jgi:hypothetical protein
MEQAKIIIDPEFAALIPPLLAEELAGLEERLKREGCRDALVVWRGQNVLLDGHHRYKLCGKLRIPVRRAEIDLPDRQAAIEWIIRNQLSRRNLTAGQRAELAIKIEPILAAKAKARQEKSRFSAETTVPSKVEGTAIDTRADAAKQAGVDPKTVDKVKEIWAKGTPETKASLRAGKTTVAAAYRQATAAKKTPEPQTDAMPEPEAGVPIPSDKPKIIEAFRRRKELTEKMGALSRIKSDVLAGYNTKDPLYVHLNESDFQAHMEGARAALKLASPFAVCPYCAGGERGAGKNCKGCKGAGWVSKMQWDAAPVELKTQ